MICAYFELTYSFGTMISCPPSMKRTDCSTA